MESQHELHNDDFCYLKCDKTHTLSGSFIWRWAITASCTKTCKKCKREIVTSRSEIFRLSNLPHSFTNQLYFYCQGYITATVAGCQHSQQMGWNRTRQMEIWHFKIALPARLWVIPGHTVLRLLCYCYFTSYKKPELPNEQFILIHIIKHLNHQMSKEVWGWGHAPGNRKREFEFLAEGIVHEKLYFPLFFWE